jgi:hypothetical protein
VRGRVTRHGEQTKVRANRAELNPPAGAGMKLALLAAIVIHVAIIATLTGAGIGSIWHPGPDTIEGSDQPTGFSGMPVKSRLHTHTVLVVDDSGKSIDSAVVHEILADRVTRTRASGVVTTTVQSGAMLVVRVTRRGYNGVTTRLANPNDSIQLDIVRLRRISQLASRPPD